jgi:hypothetical protein
LNAHSQPFTTETYEPRKNLLLSAWLSRSLPPRDFLLGKLLCTTSRWLIFGETGVGKTLLGLEIAGGVSAGSSLLGWEGSGKPRRVMYLDGEMPAETFKDRMEFIARRYGSALKLYGYNRDVLKDDDMPPLNTPEGEKWLWQEIEAVKPDLIVFDAIMCLLVGSMSEEESWAPVKALVRKISSRRIAQVWLHHTGHDNTKSFGTKTREWEMDTVVSLTKAGDEGNAIAFEFKKARLRTPETRDQFESKTLRCEVDGWVSDGQVVKSSKGDGRQEIVVVRQAIIAAYNRLADGVQTSPGFDGQPVRKVSIETIRNEVKSRGFLETNDKDALTTSARQMFHRAKGSLLSAKPQTHVESEAFLWKIRKA